MYEDALLHQQPPPNDRVYNRSLSGKNYKKLCGISCLSSSGFREYHATDLKPFGESSKKELGLLKNGLKVFKNGDKNFDDVSFVGTEDLLKSVDSIKTVSLTEISHSKNDVFSLKGGFSGFQNDASSSQSGDSSLQKTQIGVDVPYGFKKFSENFKNTKEGVTDSKEIKSDFQKPPEKTEDLDISTEKKSSKERVGRKEQTLTGTSAKKSSLKSPTFSKTTRPASRNETQIHLSNKGNDEKSLFNDEFFWSQKFLKQGRFSPLEGYSTNREYLPRNSQRYTMPSPFLNMRSIKNNLKNFGNLKKTSSPNSKPVPKFFGKVFDIPTDEKKGQGDVFQSKLDQYYNPPHTPKMERLDSNKYNMKCDTFFNQTPRANTPKHSISQCEKNFHSPIPKPDDTYDQLFNTVNLFYKSQKISKDKIPNKLLFDSTFSKQPPRSPMRAIQAPSKTQTEITLKLPQENKSTQLSSQIMSSSNQFQVNAAPTHQSMQINATPNAPLPKLDKYSNTSFKRVNLLPGPLPQKIGSSLPPPSQPNFNPPFPQPNATPSPFIPQSNAALYTQYMPYNDIFNPPPPIPPNLSRPAVISLSKTSMNKRSDFLLPPTKPPIFPSLLQPPDYSTRFFTEFDQSAHMRRKNLMSQYPSFSPDGFVCDLNVGRQKNILQRAFYLQQDWKRNPIKDNNDDKKEQKKNYENTEQKNDENNGKKNNKKQKKKKRKKNKKQNENNIDFNTLKQLTDLMSLQNQRQQTNTTEQNYQILPHMIELLKELVVCQKTPNQPPTPNLFQPKIQSLKHGMDYSCDLDQRLGFKSPLNVGYCLPGTSNEVEDFHSKQFSLNNSGGHKSSYFLDIPSNFHPRRLEEPSTHNDLSQADLTEHIELLEQALASQKKEDEKLIQASQSFCQNQKPLRLPSFSQREELLREHTSDNYIDISTIFELQQQVSQLQQQLSQSSPGPQEVVITLNHQLPLPLPPPPPPPPPSPPPPPLPPPPPSPLPLVFNQEFSRVKPSASKIGPCSPSQLSNSCLYSPSSSSFHFFPPPPPLPLFPSFLPTQQQAVQPTQQQALQPTQQQTSQQTQQQTLQSTQQQTPQPSQQQTLQPTQQQTPQPNHQQVSQPTQQQTPQPSQQQVLQPTQEQALLPIQQQALLPTQQPPFLPQPSTACPPCLYPFPCCCYCVPSSSSSDSGCSSQSDSDSSCEGPRICCNCSSGSNGKNSKMCLKCCGKNDGLCLCCGDSSSEEDAKRKSSKKSLRKKIKDIESDLDFLSRSQITNENTLSDFIRGKVLQMEQPSEETPNNSSNLPSFESLSKSTIRKPSLTSQRSSRKESKQYFDDKVDSIENMAKLESEESRSRSILDNTSHYQNVQRLGLDFGTGFKDFHNIPPSKFFRKTVQSRADMHAYNVLASNETLSRNNGKKLFFTNSNVNLYANNDRVNRRHGYDDDSVKTKRPSKLSSKNYNRSNYNQPLTHSSKTPSFEYSSSCHNRSDAKDIKEKFKNSYDFFKQKTANELNRKSRFESGFEEKMRKGLKKVRSKDEVKKRSINLKSSSSSEDVGEKNLGKNSSRKKKMKNPKSRGKLSNEKIPKQKILKKKLPKENPKKAKQTIPKQTIPKQTIPKQTIPKQTIPKQTIPKQTIPKQTIPKQTIPKQTIPKQTIPKQTIPKQTIPKQTIPKQTIPKQTIPKQKIPKNIPSNSKKPQKPTKIKKQKKNPEKNQTKYKEKNQESQETALKKQIEQELTIEILKLQKSISDGQMDGDFGLEPSTHKLKEEINDIISEIENLIAYC